MPTITVRALDPVTWDPLQGNGQANFLSDLQAMAQIIRSRLLLFKGEWFLDLGDGLPMFGGILGTQASAKNIQAITNMITSRIATTVFVIAVTNVSAAYQNRYYFYKAQVQTQFGTLFISNQPSRAALTA
jgi:hypothetical protein